MIFNPTLLLIGYLLGIAISTLWVISVVCEIQVADVQVPSRSKDFYAKVSHHSFNAMLALIMVNTVYIYGMTFYMAYFFLWR